MLKWQIFHKRLFELFSITFMIEISFWNSLLCTEAAVFFIIIFLSSSEKLFFIWVLYFFRLFICVAVHNCQILILFSIEVLNFMWVSLIWNYQKKKLYEYVEWVENKNLIINNENGLCSNRILCKYLNALSLPLIPLQIHYVIFMIPTTSLKWIEITNDKSVILLVTASQHQIFLSPI